MRPAISPRSSSESRSAFVSKPLRRPVKCWFPDCRSPFASIPAAGATMRNGSRTRTIVAEATAKLPTAAQGHTLPNATATDWIAVIAGALGALMATLDISITNSALAQIQGEIGATGTEGTWIATGYLMSEIVMIPLAAWLTRVFGLRAFLLTNTALFTIFSIICGFSHTLPQMI